jgi:cysteine desulfurase
MKKIYLDFAAATPIDDAVLRAMQPYFQDVFYNPSALYVGAREAKASLDQARSKVAQSIGAKPSEIIFTSGGTESANLAIHGVMQRYPKAELLVIAIEHEAVLRPAASHRAKLVPVDKNGIVELAELQRQINDSTVLVSVMYANNEVGSVQPIKEITSMVVGIRKDRVKRGVTLPLYVHTDACQAPQFLDVNVARLGVDLMTINGGKLHGPKQSGALFCRIGVQLAPQITGGGQEFGMRSGTENVAACVGFATALARAVDKRVQTSKTVGDLSRYFVDELEKRFRATFNGHRKLRLPNNVHVTFAGCDNERVLFSLDDQGVWAATGSACSASSDEASHVLLAMGLNESDARSSLRFSLGKTTTKEEIDATLKALETALKA